MKRLVRKAFGTTLYHGTNMEKLKQITEAGMIIPQETTGGGRIEADESLYDGYTFLATTSQRAWWYAENVGVGWDDEQPIVLELSISENALLPDDNDAPDAKTWKDSADRVQQVKILGPVTSNYFTTVYFEGENGTESVPFTDWENGIAKYWEKIQSGKDEEDRKSEEMRNDFINSISDLQQDFITDLKGAGLNASVDENDDVIVVCKNESIATYHKIAVKHEEDAFGSVFGTISQDGDIFVANDEYDYVPIAATMEFDGTTLEIESKNNFEKLKDRKKASEKSSLSCSKN